MRTVILAAGYGTRLRPDITETPKALLPVAGKRVIEYLLDWVREAPEVRDIFIVSNHEFYPQFQDWQSWSSDASQLHLLDDGTTSNETRLGSIGDLRFALGKIGMDQDLLVLGGDNVFRFSLDKFLDFFYNKGTDCITIHIQPDRQKLTKTGVVAVDGSWRVIEFDEKPQNPRSTYACPPAYLLRAEDLPLVDEYLGAGHNSDAPGHFIRWLVSRRPVYAFLFDEPRYTLGDLASYAEACEAMKKIERGGAKDER